jgi:hypothetical protein
VQGYAKAALKKGVDQRWRGIRREILGSAADPAARFDEMGSWRQFLRVSVLAAIFTVEKASSSGK